MLDIELRLLFNEFCLQKINLKKRLSKVKGQSIVSELKSKIQKVDKKQKDIIYEYISDVGLDLPKEMEEYFVQVDSYIDNTELIMEWMIDYQSTGKNIK